MNYLFDTSALVAHALHMPGAEQAQSIMEQPDVGLFASALSLFELAGVLKKNGLEMRTSEFWSIYNEGLEIIAADSALAQSAWDLRVKTAKRIPIADAIIAATACALGAILVHNDRHLAAIPDSVIPQIRLPAT